MDTEYWTPDDFVDGACTADDIGKEKPIVFAEPLEDVIVPPGAAQEDGAPRRRGRPPNAAAQARSVHESLRLAFHALGGVEGLLRWGRSHPTEFYRLCGRLIPQEIKGAVDVRQITILHALPPTELDMHPDENGVLTAPRMLGDMQPSNRLSTETDEGENYL